MFHETPEQFFHERMEAGNSYIAKESILGQRITDFHENYVVSALPIEGEAAYGDTTKDGPVPRVMRLKQGVLRRLLADIQYIQHTQPDASVTVATADAFNFAPSVSHEIALEAMRFLGITEHWLNFFAKVISPPAKFEDQETARKIQRGTPTSQALGYTMGEAILFVMDVAINQRAPGLKWYRQHDDVWFWDTDKTKVNTAWRFMEQFARISGFRWNEQKSGSCRVCSKYDIESGRVTSVNRYPGSDILPQGNVQWGLLVLDSTGRFSINQVMVDWHTQELKERFQKPHSTLQFIRAYSRLVIRPRRPPITKTPPMRTDTINLSQVYELLHPQLCSNGHHIFALAR